MKIAVASGICLISIMYIPVSKTKKTTVQQVAMWCFYTLGVAVSFCNYIILWHLDSCK